MICAFLVGFFTFASVDFFGFLVGGDMGVGEWFVHFLGPAGATFVTEFFLF